MCCFFVCVLFMSVDGDLFCYCIDDVIVIFVLHVLRQWIIVFRGVIYIVCPYMLLIVVALCCWCVLCPFPCCA